MGLWTTWSSGWYNEIIFKVPSNPKHSMIVRFYGIENNYILYFIWGKFATERWFVGYSKHTIQMQNHEHSWQIGMDVSPFFHQGPKMSPVHYMSTQHLTDVVTMFMKALWKIHLTNTTALFHGLKEHKTHSVLCEIHRRKKISKPTNQSMSELKSCSLDHFDKYKQIQGSCKRIKLGNRNCNLWLNIMWNMCQLSLT